MADGRFHDLDHARRLEGLPPEYADLSRHPMHGPKAAHWTNLYRGYVLEAGHLLDADKKITCRALKSGRELLLDLITQNGRSEWRPRAVLEYEEWLAYKTRMDAADMTAARLLNMLHRVTNLIERRKTERAASHPSNAAAA